jgi:hypothetical protein
MPETRTIETPEEKHKVEVKSYYTVGDRKTIMRFLLDHATVDEAGKIDIKSVRGGLAIELQDLQIRLAVVSFDGSQDAILERINSMKSEADYQEILNAIDALGGMVKKKDLTGSTTKP